MLCKSGRERGDIRATVVRMARHIPGAGAGRTPPEGGGESELSLLKSSSPPVATIVEQLSDESVPATSRETVRRNKAFPVICIAVRLRSCRQYTDLCRQCVIYWELFPAWVAPHGANHVLLPRIVYTLYVTHFFYCYIGYLYFEE